MYEKNALLFRPWLHCKIAGLDRVLVSVVIQLYAGECALSVVGP